MISNFAENHSFWADRNALHQTRNKRFREFFAFWLRAYARVFFHQNFIAFVAKNTETFMNSTKQAAKLCILINRSSFMARPAHVFANVFDSHRHHSVAKISLFSIRQFSLFHSARHAQTNLSRCVVFIVVNMKTVTTNTQRI